MIGIRHFPRQRLKKSHQIALFVLGEPEGVQVPFAVDVLASASVVELDYVGKGLRAAVVKVWRFRREDEALYVKRTSRR